MGRRPRVEYQGAMYHVIQRGNSREYIFEKEDEKAYLMKLVKEYKEIMGYKIYGFVIMDNHYHMIIHTLDSLLHSVMHRINTQYSKYYNYQNNRTGHVFENRYKGMLVEDETYLFPLIRYVHRNPVRACMCKRIEDYKWSSDIYYRTNIRNKIVDIDFILEILSPDRKEAIKQYRHFMDEQRCAEDDFSEKEISIGESRVPRKLIEIEFEKTKKKKSLDQILFEATRDEGIFSDIKKGSRKRNLKCYKTEYVNKALENSYTMKEIGENIRISEVAIYKIKKRK